MALERLRRAQLLLGNTVVEGQLNELVSLYLDLDLETDPRQDCDLNVEAVASSASDSSGRTARTGRCTPSTSRPGTRRKKGRRSMGEGQSGGGCPGGVDEWRGPGETCGEEGNDISAAFGVDEDNSGERVGGMADEGNEANLDDCHHDASPKIPSYPSLITSFTSSQIDTQSHVSDPSSQLPWT
ncbi:hypothetical protein DL95DRAFT_461343 [Leptodontidium sp. 2 PMI_412]|nr:hypothetical protein DL95DRAFT_461343 [Leptodontidium sp. 2 PMI_412]